MKPFHKGHSETRKKPKNILRGSGFSRSKKQVDASLDKRFGVKRPKA